MKIFSEALVAEACRVNNIADLSTATIGEILLAASYLEQKTGSVYPVIGELEALLKEEGALNAVMTGSGPTVFGIYERQEDAGKAMERLEKAASILDESFCGTFSSGAELSSPEGAWLGALFF